MKTILWFLVHNLLAHPLLVTQTKWAERFHEWTADRFHFVQVTRFENASAAFVGGALVASIAILLVVGAVDVVGTLAGWVGR